MIQHLTDEQFISYINYTLTDAEREALDRHVAECPLCRTALVDHEAFFRRLQYDLTTDLRAVKTSARMNFETIAPRIKHKRRLIMFARQSNQVMVGATTLVLLIVLGMGLFMLVNNHGQPATVPQPEIPEPVEAEKLPVVVPADEVDSPAAPVELTFTPYGNEPVLAAGSYESLDWDRSIVEPGAIIFHDGQYHMFYNGAPPGWVNYAIAYATSPDGITWTRMDTEPLLTADDVGFTEIGIKANSVLVENDGTWVIYFSTKNEATEYSTSDIGRATAPGPAGPWTPDDTLLLEPGPEGSWDGYAVLHPSVVRTEAGYAMYYTGLDGFAGTHMIGMATSTDGLTWIKYDDPATSEAPFAVSDPIFVPGEADAWDSRRVVDPSVQQTPDGWVMVYASHRNIAAGSGDPKIGYATSADGRHWTRAGEIPELIEIEAGWFTDATLLYHDGTYYLYFAALPTWKSGGAETYLATAGQPPQ